MIGALRRIVKLFSRKRKKMDDDFNLLGALADHAPDIFRDELLAKHLDAEAAAGREISFSNLDSLPVRPLQRLT